MQAATFAQALRRLERGRVIRIVISDRTVA
jgi:hypothetical protein